VAALDAVTGDQPVVLFSGDLHSAWFNADGAAVFHRPAACDAGRLA
jgi:predicted amidohydrolase YtcJ